MELVPCEWAAGGPVYDTYGTSASMELVLVVQLYWFGIEVL